MSNEPDDFDEDDGDEELARPLDRDEAASVRRDLDDLAAFRRTFEPEGYKGVSVFCTDCAEDHYYGWDMLEENLQALLDSGTSPVHEPPFDPHPDDYIDWPYAQGYLDGLGDAGVPALPAPLPRTTGCPYCGVQLPDGEGDGRTITFCPTCGMHLGTAKVARVLLEEGWSHERVAELLRSARLPPLRGLPVDESGRGEAGSSR